MTVRLEDFGGSTNARTIDELVETLGRRFDGANSFWLSHDEAKHPTLSILVRDDLACLHYFPYESHPGFLSAGSTNEFNPSKATRFFMESLDQEQEIPNSAVIQLSEAIDAAKEFYFSKKMPRVIKWSEL